MPKASPTRMKMRASGRRRAGRSASGLFGGGVSGGLVSVSALVSLPVSLAGAAQ
ncbi:MAG: hypothetical protein KGL46_03390 [Hyphomicrobiales bacterium]|nr:hypothetical protein [Hyphomicrobiales bacterium]